MNDFFDLKSITNRVLKLFQAEPAIKGNVLVYLVLVLLIFGVLGVTIFSIFSTATQSATEPNHFRRARYIRESAIRYSFSELRDSEFDPAVIATLNSISTAGPYKIEPDGEFKLAIFSPWFDSDETKVLPIGSGGTLDLKISRGMLQDDWVAKDPNDLWLLNYDYFDQDLTPARNDIASWTKIDDTTLRVTLNADFSANKGERICLAALPTESRTISDGGDLYLQEEARRFFPAQDGAININRIDYVYERLVPDLDNNRVILEGVSASTMPNTGTPFPLTVDNTYSSGIFTGDFIVLSPPKLHHHCDRVLERC